MKTTQPDNVIKYCLKCGSDEFLYDGSKSFKCQTCGFHFFINSAAAVAAIIVNNKGEILLTRRTYNPGKGMLDLPGGFVDPMESAESALKREIKEELNLDIVAADYLVSFPNEYVFSEYSVYTTDLSFVCQVQSFDNMHVKDDIEDFVFHHPETIPFEEIFSESIQKILHYYLNA